MEQNLCRICLLEGTIPIFDGEAQTKLLADIIKFGDIKINKYDTFPEYICYSCLDLLNSATRFRYRAQKSDKLLKNMLSTEHTTKIHDPLKHPIGNITQTSPSVISKTGGERLTFNNECEEFKKYINKLSNISFKGNVKEDNGEQETIIIIVVKNDESEKTAETHIEEFSCNICCMDFESLEDYHQHLNTTAHVKAEKGANKINCHICGKLVTLANYERHIEKHNTADLKNSLECELCNQLFETTEQYESHNERHKIKPDIVKSATKLSKVECKMCGKFITKSYVRLHSKLHGTDGKMAESLCTCPYCLKSVSFSYLRSHIKRKHTNICLNDNVLRVEDLEPRCFVCDKCGKIFKRKSALQSHLLTHGSEFMYKCNFCPYRGLHKSLLRIHMCTHTGEYNYKCTKCSARFITKSNLCKHLKRHDGPIDYKCNLCNRGFYTKLDLDRHNKVQHLGIKNHICNICGKAFGYRNGMMCHQIKVHKRKRLTTGKGRLPNYLVAELQDTDAKLEI